jgi:hypothetical protein
MFTQVSEQKHVQKGNFFAFFTNGERFSRYMKCIGIGLPTWFIIGILATFSNEFGKAFGITDPVKPGLTIMWCYIGLAIGDLASGFISQGLKSRKQAVSLLMGFTLIVSLIYVYIGPESVMGLYMYFLAMGFGIGYWAMFVTIGAEQFGTNLRATAATTVPNMVRGTVILMTNLYAYLKPSFDIINAGVAVGFICFALGFYSILTIPETHGKDLNYLEE